MIGGVKVDFVQNNIFWFALALFSGGAFVWQSIRGSGVADIIPVQASLLINREDALVLDVRDAAEFNAGRIPNAKHIPLAQMAQRLGELDKWKEKPIIAYCQSGNRSASACAALKKAGFTQVHNLNGGLPAWQDANLPVTRK